MIQLSVILPVYNQADIIGPVYKEIYNCISKLKIPFECILVENGSTDQTLDKVIQLSKTYPHTISATTAKGYGSAVIKGLTIVHGKYVCYMPSDGQVDLTVIPKLWQLALSDKYDIVKIKRINRESPIRTFFSKFLAFSLFLKFRTPIIDINGSPRILKTEKMKTLNLTYLDSFIDAQMTVYSRRLKWKIIEIPMTNLPRYGGQSSRNIMTYFEFIKNVLTFS